MSHTSSSSLGLRPYDLVIYGANGYTGRLTVAYLLTQQKKAAREGDGDAAASRYAGLRWAVAGRSRTKLEAMVTELCAAHGSTESIDILVASVDDASSLDAMCSKAKVLLTLAGPYLTCGVPIAKACVRNGTHYMDITGEMHFIRELVDTLHDDAKARKVAIVNSCGFDCVPSDIGAFMVHQHVERLATSAAPPGHITSMECYFTIKGNLDPSGGTAATLSSTFLTQSAEDHNPLSINPPQYRSRIPAPIRKWMRWTPVVGKYSGPFLMACENERIVRRSNCLLGRPQVAYCEAIAGNFMTVFMELLQFWAINVLMPIRFLNAIVLWFLPKQGQGPSEKEKKGSSYEATFIAHTSQKRSFRGEWIDNRNAYDTTAVFVVEIAHQLAKSSSLSSTFEGNGDGSESFKINQFGVVTPAAALGDQLLKSLVSNCGIITSISEEDTASHKGCN